MYKPNYIHTYILLLVNSLSSRIKTLLPSPFFPGIKALILRSALELLSSSHGQDFASEGGPYHQHSLVDVWTHDSAAGKIVAAHIIKYADKQVRVCHAAMTPLCRVAAGSSS